MSNTTAKKTKFTEQELFEHAEEHGYRGEPDYGEVEIHFLKKGKQPKRVGSHYELVKAGQ